MSCKPHHGLVTIRKKMSRAIDPTQIRKLNRLMYAIMSHTITAAIHYDNVALMTRAKRFLLINDSESTYIVHQLYGGFAKWVHDDKSCDGNDV